MKQTIIKRSHDFDSAIREIQFAIDNEVAENRRRSYPLVGNRELVQGMRNAIRVLKGAYRPDLGRSYIDCQSVDDKKVDDYLWVDDEEDN